MLLKEISQIQHDLLALNAIDYEKPRVSGGNGRNAMEDRIIGFLDKRDKMLREYLQTVNRPWEFKKLVECMDDERMQAIMKRHYLWHETWEKACEGICSDSWLRRKENGLRAQALEEFDKIFKKNKISSC
nr:MAG TPA: hypothetical protein [Caudoviricetes sp.]DAV63512.1 MAG TPA: hypothetical protein [Caudoviricetes sp.]